MTDNTHSPYAAKNARDFSEIECVFAWLSYILAFVFCRVFPIHESPLGAFIFIAALFAATAVTLMIRGERPGFLSYAAMVSALLVSSSLIITDNAFIIFFAYLYAICAYFYFVYSACGNSTKKGFSDLLLIDFIKALFVMPLHSLQFIFLAVFHGKAKSGGKLLLKLLFGLLIAIVPTTIVILLLGYDQSFLDLLDKITPSFDFDLFSYIYSLFCAVPISMYIYGAFISSVDKKCNDVLTEEKCSVSLTKIKIAPTVTAIAAVLPLLCIYVVFFISQWKYYVSGFTGVLPENFSYAEYAREGFFQLCAVSVINLIIIGALIAFMKRNTAFSKVIFKVICITLSVFTLVLITTAISKMVMYIDSYGLTPLRVYATWFMSVLSAIFVLMIIKQFVSKTKYVAASICICIVMFAALSLCNVDGFIAKYNVDRYLEGSLKTVDMDAMDDLGYAAIPHLCRIAEKMDEEMGTDIKTAELSEYPLTSTYYRLGIRLRRAVDHFNSGEDDVFDFTFPKHRAKKALSEYGFFEETEK